MRLVFTATGLAATTFAISPLHHTLFAALCLRHPGFAVPGSPWRDLARRTPAKALPFIRRVHRIRLSKSGFLWVDMPLPTGTQAVTDELDMLTSCGHRDIADALRAFYTCCVAPEWNAIRHRLSLHVSRCAELISTRGLGVALSHLTPRLSWDDCALHIDTSGVMPPPFDLGDRGVTFSPLLSATRHFMGFAFTCDDPRPVLTYPVADAPPPAATVDTLAQVVGQARARVLRSIGSGTATGELARSLAVSASTASEHLTALRQAGLVDTRREGRAVRHVLTALGHELLASTA
ncbi:ArsR/SmtB family transcription factor [Nonomuraea sediminis]|uniref:ArsR/SmtB family transcription factor n=1 Tax=Nonomuraea sediminis TaxID=2835864 RepID=UPI001BDC7A77|nr:winged helix-turn-helix domain-containing protein [Nonomuraea sediminis]